MNRIAFWWCVFVVYIGVPVTFGTLIVLSACGVV